ncbi:MAG: Hydrolase, alpha/beta fold family [uncultured Thiotrichaceae bacterium]|uniref:Hydrolase, alpha/beta fold family n=1 Tax=uncultured Thiotrichaceae bacterium TaxID=298394 RepID=A0A6S6TJH7_9GAMM|nr:MAG: Hydrolase, alpha/beta fold family [uncultured Thiotrichaceae bacterium]
MKAFWAFLALLGLTGCTAVSPVTWKERVERKPAQIIPQLHYEEQGTGETLLLLHGLGESSFTWRYLVDDLAKQYRVISLDMKGFGKSPKPRDGRYSIYDQAIVVKQFIEQQQLDKFTLVGHSLGGGVALALTLMAEQETWDIERLVLIDAAAYKQNLPSMLRDLSKPVVGDIGIYVVSPTKQAKQAYKFSFYNDMKIPSEGVKEYARNLLRPRSRYVFLQSTKQLIPEDIEAVSQQYAQIQQPTLIIWGYHDVVIHRRNAKRLHNDLTNSTLKLIRDAGHMPQEETPKQVFALITDWLSKQ